MVVSEVLTSVSNGGVNLLRYEHHLLSSLIWGSQFPFPQLHALARLYPPLRQRCSCYQEICKAFNLGSLSCTSWFHSSSGMCVIVWHLQVLVFLFHSSSVLVQRCLETRVKQHRLLRVELKKWKPGQLETSSQIWWQFSVGTHVQRLTA